MTDYRNSKYCPMLSNLKQKKQALVKNIKEEYPRKIDMHSVVRENNKKYKIDFMKIYNCKCAYCGVSIDILGHISDFEIDHFKNEKSFSSKAKAGSIDNLILACRACNRKKSSFLIKDDSKYDLHPDGREILNNFIRDDLYNIVLSDKAKLKKNVIDFYCALDLKNETHRIDYLLINIIGLIKKLDKAGYRDIYIINELRKIKDRLLDKRKYMN